MEYHSMKRGTFISRPNRFIAHVQIDGVEVVAHVKNTGRFKELLIPGAIVYVQDHGNSTHRKTNYSLITVEKGNCLVNLDSQVTNKIVGEALIEGRLPLPGFDEDILRIRPESTFGSSRFDFYLEGHSKKAYLEVKAVTLEEEHIARFPDAPTERGIKHLKELETALSAGFLAYAVFVIQMDNVISFRPNDITHLAFGDALRHAGEKGVTLLAYSCSVTKDTIRLANQVPIDLKRY